MTRLRAPGVARPRHLPCLWRASRAQASRGRDACPGIWRASRAQASRGRDACPGICAFGAPVQRSARELLCSNLPDHLLPPKGGTGQVSEGSHLDHFRGTWLRVSFFFFFFFFLGKPGFSGFDRFSVFFEKSRKSEHPREGETFWKKSKIGFLPKKLTGSAMADFFENP